MFACLNAKFRRGNACPHHCLPPRPSTFPLQGEERIDREEAHASVYAKGSKGRDQEGQDNVLQNTCYMYVGRVNPRRRREMFLKYAMYVREEGRKK